MTNEVTNILGYRLAKSVEISLNQVLTNGGEMIDLSRMNHENNYWNMTLLQDPFVSKDFISFILDGTFHSSNSFMEQRTQEFPLMPIFVGEPSSVKV